MKRNKNKAAEIINELLKKENLTNTDLAERLGVSRQSVSQKLCRGSIGMRFDSFDKMVQALGYEVTVKRKA